MFYSAAQAHVAGGANEALYPGRQDGRDNSTQTPNSTATSATLNPSRSFMSVSPFPAERIMAIAFSSEVDAGSRQKKRVKTGI
jgi:hypothetical protein